MCSNVQLDPGYEPHFPSLLVTHMSHMSIELLSFPKKGFNITDQSLLEHFKPGSMEMEMLKAGDQFASCFYQSAHTCLSFLCSGVAGFVLTPAEAILDPEEKKSFGGNQTSLLLLLVLLLSDIMLAAMKKLQNAAQPFSPVLEMREIYFPNREKYSFQTKRNMFIKL